MAIRHITTLIELQGLVQDILFTCVLKNSATILALSGDLGAGKTALVKELGKLLGIEHEITSPTFVIMKSYSIPKISNTAATGRPEPVILNAIQGASEAYDQAVVKPTVRGVSERSNTEVRQNNWLWLTHIDAYRIESDDEMRVLGFDALLQDPSQLICIEWPEKIQNLIPENAVKIALTLNSDGTRDVTYEN